MRSAPRVLALAAAAALTFTACGGSDDADDGDDEAADTEAPAESEPPAETDPPVETEPPPAETDAPVETEAPAETDAPVETEAPTEPEEGDPGAGVPVALFEWGVDAPTEYAAGTITFAASNGGSFPHELVVIAGDGYESLPLAEGGAVVEEDLPDGALIARTERIGSGSERELVVELAPGNYVLVCNLGGGANSHAGLGQTLDITVS